LILFSGGYATSLRLAFWSAVGKYFFLSYARLDRKEDPYDCIGKFYKDLVREIREKTAEPLEEIAFFDERTIEPGHHWPIDLSNGLATCRVFVSMYSPTYFTREHCGKEWQIFQSRLASFERSKGSQHRPPLILPVLLEAPSYIPIAQFAPEIQYAHEDFPESYKNEGLRYLVRLGPRRDYRRFVTQFSQKVIRAAREYELEPMIPLPDIGTVRSAFHSGKTGAATASAGRSAPPTGPRYAQFFFVAARSSELASIRRDLAGYGLEGGADWKPFLPPCDDDVAIIAQGVAHTERLIFETVPLSEDLIERLRAAKASMKPVVVIVDPWTIRLEEYSALMRRYDEYDSYNCAVLIPANAADEETSETYSDLNEVITRVFEAKVSRGTSDLFAYPVASLESFKKKLSVALTRMKMDLIRHSRPVRIALGTHVVSKPVISGPRGD
jgi:FxsC-like protein